MTRTWKDTPAAKAASDTCGRWPTKNHYGRWMKRLLSHARRRNARSLAHFESIANWKGW